jgi:hypothetical protein
MAALEEETTAQEARFQELESYNWSADEEFQAGLQAILGPNPAPQQVVPLTLRARCFYYSRQVIMNRSFLDYR